MVWVTSFPASELEGEIRKDRSQGTLQIDKPWQNLALHLGSQAPGSELANGVIQSCLLSAQSLWQLCQLVIGGGLVNTCLRLCN